MFALAETILSVAILVILAGFSTRMLISAKNNNAKTYDLYQGLCHAVNVIEAIKGESNLQTVSQMNFDSGAVFCKNEGSLTLNVYYNHDWTPIPSGEQKPCYAVKAQVEPLGFPDRSGESLNNTYSIKVRVTRLTPYVLEKSQKNEIVFLETLKWFTHLDDKEGKVE